MTSPRPLLQVLNLTVRLQIGTKSFPVLDRISFDLMKGKTLALVGESGSGKTMSALAIMRILPTPPALPPEGSIIYQGMDLLKLPENKMRAIRGARIGMIFQDPMSSLNPVYTIGSQLMEVVELHLGLYGEEGLQRILKALSEVKLPNPEEIIKKYPHQLSGGMKQRVMIAMALLCEPDILIADEPTTALDVTIQAQILNLIRELQNRKGMAVLLITHDMGVVAELADDVVVMYATQAVERGSVLQIFEEKSHPYTQALFQSRPDLNTPKGKLQAIKGSVPSLNHLPSGCHFHPRCPYVMKICQEGEVPDFDVEDTTHQAKCWLYAKSPFESTQS